MLLNKPLKQFTYLLLSQDHYKAFLKQKVKETFSNIYIIINIIIRMGTEKKNLFKLQNMFDMTTMYNIKKRTQYLKIYFINKK